MKLLRLMGLTIAIAPLFGCAHYQTREERYQESRAAARRQLERRLADCGWDEPCRARARQAYDLRMAEIERYRM